jgi:hypothetical protein
MYTAKNLKWCKNVLRDGGDGTAYNEYGIGDVFPLHWATKWPGSVLTAPVGDIMLIFQTPKIISGKRNRTVMLTHLVTPVDVELLTIPDNPKYMYARRVRVIGKANPINAIPNPGYFIFHKPNRGQTHPISNLENRIGLTEPELQQRIWELFDEYLDPEFAQVSEEDLFPAIDFGEKEGDREIRNHVRQEIVRRNSAIVIRAKREALKKGNGRVQCECCNFDFLTTYRTIGSEFIEAHHRIHLAKGERITRVEDLALVCSNCHRMLHRKKENGDYHTPDSLKTLLNS